MSKPRITKKMYEAFVNDCSKFHWDNAVCSLGSMVCKCDFAIVLQEINKRFAVRRRRLRRETECQKKK